MAAGFRDTLRRRDSTAIDDFISAWHGPSARSEGKTQGSDELPAELARFYDSYFHVASGIVVNRLLAPNAVYVDGDFTVFAVEEQAVHLWGVRTEDLRVENPPVWGRENEPGALWCEESPSVTTFLLQLVAASAAINAPFGAAVAWLSAEETDRALNALDDVRFPAWHWPGSPARWYADDKVVAFVAPNRAGAHDFQPLLSVWVGALENQHVRFLEPHVTEKWEYFSLRDGAGEA